MAMAGDEDDAKIWICGVTERTDLPSDLPLQASTSVSSKHQHRLCLDW